MTESRKYSTSDKDYKGVSKDILNREVHIFSDDSEIHAVYFLGETDEYCATELVSKIKQNPDEYLYTPYLEFVDFYK